MEDNTKVIGLWDNVMDLEFLLGQMDKNTKDNMCTDRSRVMEFLLGQMEKYIKEDGFMENSMEKVKLVLKGLVRVEYGKMGYVLIDILFYFKL